MRKGLANAQFVVDDKEGYTLSVGKPKVNLNKVPFAALEIFDEFSDVIVMGT